MRLSHLKSWVEAWALEAMIAGIPGRGAAQATWGATALAEHLRANGVHFAGLAVDVYKYLDQLPRPIVDAILRRVGFLLKLHSAYR